LTWESFIRLRIMKKEELSKRLKEAGLKATPQRILILDFIMKHGHIGIETLYEKMKDIIPSISIATIYKNLKILEEKGLVREVSISSFKSLYELKNLPHIHIVCEKCRSVSDFFINEAEIKKYFKNLTNFDVNKVSIILFVECEKCKVSES